MLPVAHGHPGGYVIPSNRPAFLVFLFCGGRIDNERAAMTDFRELVKHGFILFPHGVINVGSGQALLCPHFFAGDMSRFHIR